ncbi:UNVERIFIED_CONTAM: hypothetical protein RMT77_016338 [Armadillidium vulgare]
MKSPEECESYDPAEKLNADDDTIIHGADLIKKFESDDSSVSDHDEVSISKKSPKDQILWACENGKLDFISKLLEDDPSLVNAQDSDEYTPLHRASYSNQPEVIKILLKAGANVNSRTIDGWTPLHSASKWNNFKCASILIDSGIDINAVTNSGQTALHLAATNPNAIETAQLLLMDFKIDLSIKNSVLETATDIANRCSPFAYMFSISDPVLNPLNTEDKYDFEELE